MSENIAVSNESDILEEEMPDGQDWGDSSDDPGTNSELPASGETPLMFTPEESTPEESSADDQPLPPELRKLISVSGIQLIRCDNAWNVEGWAGKLCKYLSVTFTIDEEITGEDILNGFEDAGFDVTKIVSIQHKISNRSLNRFSEQAEKDRVIAKGHCTIKGTVVFLGDADTHTEIVKIFEAPDEMPDTVVIGHLSWFGRVLSFRRDVAPAMGVRNGVRTARMRVSRDIPCSVLVAGEALSIKDASQPRLCRRCGGAGHFANDWKLPRCYNCDLSGHRAMECEESVLSGVCFRSTHPLSECPFVLFSANVASSYVEAAKGEHTAKKSHPERTPEQQEAMQAAAETAKKRESDKEKQKQRKKSVKKRSIRRRSVRRRSVRRKSARKEKRKSARKEKRKNAGRGRKSETGEKDDEDERRKRDERRKDNQDWDWSRSRERSSRERDRDYDRYWDYDRDRYYRDKDRDRRHRDHSPHYSDSEYESSRRSHRY